MRWIKRLYVGEHAEQKKDRILRGIRESRVQLDVYVLQLSMRSRQLEIISSLMLLQSWYKNSEEYIVVGISKGQEEARLLLMQIVRDAMKRLGEPDLYRYLSLRMEEEGVDD